MAAFGLTLHEEKTRLIEFGRLSAMARKQRGERRPGTFAFLGFTHYCAWTRDGRFVVKRKTQRQRATAKLKALNETAKRWRRQPVHVQHQWLSRVLRGHYQYYGLPSNSRAMHAFSHHVRRIWFRALYRRSQRRLTWAAFAHCWAASRYQLLESRTHTCRDMLPRGDLREEPYAGKPHVRICEGEAEWPSYSTSPTRSSIQAEALQISIRLSKPVAASGRTTVSELQSRSLAACMPAS